MSIGTRTMDLEHTRLTRHHCGICSTFLYSPAMAGLYNRKQQFVMKCGSRLQWCTGVPQLRMLPPAQSCPTTSPSSLRPARARANSRSSSRARDS